MWYKESGLNFCSVGMILEHAEKLANAGHTFIVEDGIIYEEVEGEEIEEC